MKRLLLAAALLVTALPAAAVSAQATETGVLVISGPGGSTTDLVLRQPVQLSGVQGALSGGDDYAGVLVERVDVQGLSFGLLQVRAFRDGTQSAVAALGAEPELPAGRYRVTLFGDGPVTARYELGDQEAKAVRVRTTRRQAVQFLGRAEELLDGRSRATVQLPRSLPAGKRAVLVTLMRGVRVDDLRSCATTATTCPQALPTSIGTDDTPSITASVVPAATAARNLVFSADGYRQAVDSLRAVALVF